ncbi:MAG TPA: SDR family oxidoreductase, partial [Solirubrobacterales bacterium]|nr:SDR family oxidoreductase [Solirubrobacterales bacterium]
DLDLGAAEASAAALAGAEACRLDVADPDSWRGAVAGSGPLHGLVNCAGIDVPGDNVEQCSVEDWQRVMGVNLDGTFLGTKAVAERMRADGGGGSIVNISSVLGNVADGETISYGASKAAVRGLTKSAALALAKDGIRCNTVHPGYIRTPMTERWLESLGAEGERALVALHPIGRLGDPLDIARVVLYLLGEDSAYVTGSEFAVDGGYLAV